MRKKCSSDQENLLKLEAEEREFAKEIRTIIIQIGKKILGFRNLQEKLENEFPANSKHNLTN